MARFTLSKPALKQLAVPSVCILIAFLAYSSQYVFHHLEPGPLTRQETIWFNLLVACIWLSYERACRLDPGRLPKKIAEAAETRDSGVVTPNWCKKCDAVKPQRAHHCRQCGRCIPKMDHHCPWTANCVSHTTFPHFLRFVLYAVLSMLLLEYHLYIRGYAIWQQRNLPSYLGPSMGALAHLFVLIGVNSLMLFALTVMVVSAGKSLFVNTTMIEMWEIERHEVLVEKARYLGGYVQGPGGRRVRIRKQEFPYDIGLWKNLVQGMGSANFLLWLLPFGGGPSNETGWKFEINGFEDVDVTWPPPDPDKMYREPARRRMNDHDPFVHGDVTPEDEMAAFRKRQEQDRKRWRGTAMENRRLNSVDDGQADFDSGDGDDYDSEYEEGIDGEAGWTNSDGDRLRDYGVDEEAELIDDDDIPLGELLRRRKAAAQR